MDKINSNHLFFNPDPQIKKEKSKKSDKSKRLSKEDTSLFSEMLSEPKLPSAIELQNGENLEQKVSELLKEIGNQGRKFKRSRNLDDLEDYKRLIEEYITLVVDNSISLENKTLHKVKNFEKQSITKVHVKVINKELLELTRVFFAEQNSPSGPLSIARKIDIIEGLLINLVS